MVYNAGEFVGGITIHSSMYSKNKEDEYSSYHIDSDNPHLPSATYNQDNAYWFEDETVNTTYLMHIYQKKRKLIDRIATFIDLSKEDQSFKFMPADQTEMPPF